MTRCGSQLWGSPALAVLLALVAVGSVACSSDGSSEPGDGPPVGVDAGPSAPSSDPPSADPGEPEPTDPEPTDPDPEPEPTDPDPDPEPTDPDPVKPNPDPTTGTVFGTVTRSTRNSGDGFGDLYIAVFAGDPVRQMQNAELVDIVVIEGVDFSADDTVIEYRIDNIPPRAEPYPVLAFFDDNENVNADAPGPDRGDLLSLDGFGAPTADMSEPAEVEVDLELNFSLPF